MTEKFQIAILASGNGSNAEEIIKYFRHHNAISVELVASNNPNAMVLTRAKKYNIRTVTFNREEFVSNDLTWIQKEKITHIVLAGFLWLIPASILKAFPDRIINIHPALLPKFGGKGMYGMKIHEQVRLQNETETGITIHSVTDKYDEGPVLYQAKCEVLPNDSPEQIAQRVHALEYACYPRVIEHWILNTMDSLSC